MRSMRAAAVAAPMGDDDAGRALPHPLAISCPIASISSTPENGAKSAVPYSLDNRAYDGARAAVVDGGD